jgi:hypothetical protein
MERQSANYGMEDMRNFNGLSLNDLDSSNCRLFQTGSQSPLTYLPMCGPQTQFDCAFRNHGAG